MQVIRCLYGTWNYGMVYGNQSQGLQGYTESGFIEDTLDRRSTTGMIFTLFGDAIRWQSQLQPTILRSTYEAEYIHGSQCRSFGCYMASEGDV